MKYIKAVILVIGFLFGSAQAQNTITTCNGEYALCAASTCQPTGKTITVNNGSTYPEVVCRCPILNGVAIADTAAGNMKGSCTATDSNHVWSLFAPKLYYPQEASNFSKKREDMKAVVQKCDASLNQGYNASNCFSFNCKKGKDGSPFVDVPWGKFRLLPHF